MPGPNYSWEQMQDYRQENYESLEPEEEDQPDFDEDCFIASNGYEESVSCEGRFIAEFKELHDAIQCVKQWQKDNQYFPNVWWVSDHGNIFPVILED